MPQEKKRQNWRKKRQRLRRQRGRRKHKRSEVREHKLIMYQSDTEIIFPMRVAPNLKNLRGPEWDQLVDRACGASEASIDQLAFNLLLIRLNNCLNCHSASYRALRGCTYCSTHAVRRFPGADTDLTAMFSDAIEEVISYFQLDGESFSL